MARREQRRFKHEDLKVRIKFIDCCQLRVMEVTVDSQSLVLILVIFNIHVNFDKSNIAVS